MEYRTLGSTTLKVSVIGFGAWAIGGMGWGSVDDAESLRALQVALDEGVNFIDTADAYGEGHSEELVACVISGHRDQIIIATKVGNDFYHQPRRKNFAPDYVTCAVEQSLRRLATDYIDVYQLHNPSPEVIREGGVFEALDRLKEAGKIRHWGVSIGPPSEGLAVLQNTRPATLQLVYNLLHREPEESLFPQIRQRNIGVIARVPLASGLLTGKFDATTRFAPDDHRSRWSLETMSANLERVEKLRFLAGERTMAQAALWFVIQQPSVSVVIPGAKTVKQVQENVRTLLTPCLTPAEMAQVAQLG